MDAWIHSEQRMTARHKMFGTPLGPEYLAALGGCVRLNAQLGFVDAGLPLARKLIGLIEESDGGESEGGAEAAVSLLVLAQACRAADRFADALELDDAARAWLARRRPGHAELLMDSVAAVATDHAGLGRPDRALAVLEGERDDPSSYLVHHPLARPAIRFAAQLKELERAAAQVERHPRWSGKQ
jgi:hypothetical protein